MKKSRNIGKQNIYVFKVEIPVSLRTFTTALSNYFFDKQLDLEEIESLTKTEAKSILIDQLRFYGLEGRYCEIEVGEHEEIEYIDIKNKCFFWVKKNYPYLINNDNEM